MKKHDVCFSYLSPGILNFGRFYLNPQGAPELTWNILGLNVVPIVKSEAKSSLNPTAHLRSNRWFCYTGARHQPLEGQAPPSQKSFGSYGDRVTAAFDYVYKRLDEMTIPVTDVAHRCSFYHSSLPL